MEATIRTLATKDDLSNLSLKIKDDVASVRKDIGESLKWMFIFWVGQIGAMLGIIMLFVKK